MKKWLLSLVALTGLGVSASQAQFFPPPVTNPYVRPGVGPFYNPYMGGLYGNPYGNPILNPYGGGAYGGGPYGGGPYGAGIYGAPYVNPGLAQPGIAAVPAGGAVLALDPTGQGVDPLDPNAGNITGHATAFNSYRSYFFNQGGAAVYTAAGASQLNILAGTDPNRLAVGVAPPRGRGNTTRP